MAFPDQAGSNASRTAVLLKADAGGVVYVAAPLAPIELTAASTQKRGKCLISKYNVTRMVS